MKFSKEEVMQFIMEEDVKFVRLAFCDVFGNSKNISIVAEEIERAFEYGIAIDASSILGFGGEVHSDLFLHPDPDTIAILPWRPEHGRVIRMYCKIAYPDGTLFENDTRSLLKKAVDEAKEKGYTFYFGSEMEFYLFKLDEEGEPTKKPHDNASYMDIAPRDKGENVRREICLSLDQMGIQPESSHHEEGPGQNEIDFRYSGALEAADNAATFASVVGAIAFRNGLCADFSPKPLADKPGNGFHINMSVQGDDGSSPMQEMIAGILDKIGDITLFLNNSKESYDRLGNHKAPHFISWSNENRSQLVRVPAAEGKYVRAELRSADPAANPYLAFTLLIYAGLYGIENKLELQEATDFNLYTASEEITANFKQLPTTLEAAKALTKESTFIKDHLPQSLVDAYCK